MGMRHLLVGAILGGSVLATAPVSIITQQAEAAQTAVKQKKKKLSQKSSNNCTRTGRRYTPGANRTPAGATATSPITTPMTAEYRPFAGLLAASSDRVRVRTFLQIRVGLFASPR